MNQELNAVKEMSFIIRLLHLSHRIEREADRCFFAPHGLSMASGRILMCLYHTSGKSPTDLTEIIGGKKSNTTQRIALLKKAGFVELKNLELGDRRRVMITLTDKGKETASKMDEIFRTHIHEFEQGISDEQKEVMNSVVNLIHKKLDSIDCLHSIH